jgi:hypothetical protein
MTFEHVIETVRIRGLCGEEKLLHCELFCSDFALITVKPVLHDGLGLTERDELFERQR